MSEGGGIGEPLVLGPLGFGTSFFLIPKFLGQRFPIPQRHCSGPNAQTLWFEMPPQLLHANLGFSKFW